jgi:hypothetical protein
VGRLVRAASGSSPSLAASQSAHAHLPTRPNWQLEQEPPGHWQRSVSLSGRPGPAPGPPGQCWPVCTVQDTVTVSGAREVACFVGNEATNLTKPQRPVCLHRLLPESDANRERSCNVHIIDKILEPNNVALLSSDGSELLIG